MRLHGCGGREAVLCVAGAASLASIHPMSPGVAPRPLGDTVTLGENHCSRLCPGGGRGWGGFCGSLGRSTSPYFAPCFYN